MILYFVRISDNGGNSQLLQWIGSGILMAISESFSHLLHLTVCDAPQAKYVISKGKT
jgi:hypothetical protein